MIFRSSSLFASLLLGVLIPAGATAKDEAMTAAPPATQNEIIEFLKMTSRSHGCAKPGRAKVVSSEISADAVIEAGRLASGKVHEVWSMRMCGPKIKYLFALSPNSSGGLKISGFEPVR